jgi:hypothetical protein
MPDPSWEHYEVWRNVYELLESLPNYFKSEIVIRGINVTDIFSVGSMFSTIIESQIVTILNKLRDSWDKENRYFNYAFTRQSQTFPDILFAHAQKPDEIIFGIELKAWYVFSKESEPSFRFTVDPDACGSADLLVVTPWVLSDVVAGSPVLMTPFIEMGRYAAEYRNYCWVNSREETGVRSTSITRPPTAFRHPYPKSKVESSDKAEGDKGNNFGRIARSGLLDEFLLKIKSLDYLGVRIAHWMKFFKVMSENRSSLEIDAALNSMLESIKKEIEDKETPQNKIILRRLVETLKELIDGMP